MGWSVADTLERLVPPADEVLGGEARARLQALAARLPAALTRVVYVEAWIGQPRPRLDLIVKIDPDERKALAELARSMHEATGAADWRHVERFALLWAAPEGPLHQALSAAWLELDLDPLRSPEEALRAPRIFVDFTREVLRDASVDTRLALAGEVLWALSGSRAPQTLASLRSCLERLPQGASVAFLGVFPRDGELPIARLCVVGLDGRLTGYLDAIGWRGEADKLARRLLGPLARAQGDGAQPVGVLHLDLAPEVCPRLGLEYTFPRRRFLGGLRSPDTFLRQLVARGWCTPRSYQALRSWPRKSIELLPHDLWHSRVTRQLGHVKLTYTPGEPVVAKAYLRTRFELLADGTLLHGRPRMFGPENRAAAPSDGGGPLSKEAVAPPPLQHSTVFARTIAGAAVAYLPGKTRRSSGMTMSPTHQEVLDQVLSRATVDVDFRKALLLDPRKAILNALGVHIPANFRVKFIEREKNVDALIVLPDLQRQDGELDDDDLDAVAGGVGTDPTPTW